MLLEAFDVQAIGRTSSSDCVISQHDHFHQERDHGHVIAKAASRRTKAPEAYWIKLGAQLGAQPPASGPF